MSKQETRLAKRCAASDSIRNTKPGLYGRCALASILLGICLLAAQGATPQTPSQLPLQRSPMPLPKEITLPASLHFTLWNGLMVVQGMVNGPGIERFVIDTGLNACALSLQGFKRHDVKLLPQRVRAQALDNLLDAPEGQIDSLQLGGLKLANVRVAQSDVFAALSRSFRPDAPAGWLGAPFLSAFQITVDFSARTLQLESPEAKLPAPHGAVVLPIVVREGQVWVKVAVPGAKPFLALVDTGARGTLIPTEVAAKLKLKPQQVFTLARATGQEAKAGLIVLPRLSAGRAEVKELPVVFLAADAPPEFDRNLAVLGLDFLSRFKITLNYAKQKMVLAPLPPPASDESDEPTALQ